MKTTVIFVAFIAGVVYARPEESKPVSTSCINPPQPSSEKPAPAPTPAEKLIPAAAEPQVQKESEKPAPAVVVAEEKYTTKYDNVDLDEILKSDRLLKGYFNCLMEKGACTPDGEELKSILPDALQTGCSKCNEKQRDGARKVIHHLIDNRREMWDELEAKYDKMGEYRKRYKPEIEKEGLKL